MRVWGTIALALSLAACGMIDGRSDNTRPQPRQQSTERLPSPSTTLSQCLSGLDRAGVRYRRLPDREHDDVPARYSALGVARDRERDAREQRVARELQQRHEEPVPLRKEVHDDEEGAGHRVARGAPVQLGENE